VVFVSEWSYVGNRQKGGQGNNDSWADRWQIEGGTELKHRILRSFKYGAINLLASILQSPKRERENLIASASIKFRSPFEWK
jgi:hypothetical protein